MRWVSQVGWSSGTSNMVLNNFSSGTGDSPENEERDLLSISTNASRSEESQPLCPVLEYRDL